MASYRRIRRDQGTGPPHPSCAVHLGIVGHRHLPDADLPALRAALCGVFAEVQCAASAAVARDAGTSAPLLDGTPCTLRCVSALAEGVDRIAAAEAVKLGYSLLAPLPFARERYARDNATAPLLAEYEELLARAETVFELDVTDAHGIADDDAAYEAVGRLVLEQSDFLVAVWNGAPERGLGGTAQIVREAVARDIPVIVIDAAAPHRRRTLLPAADGTAPATLADVVTRLVFLPGRSRHDAVAFFAETVRDARLAVRLAAGVEGLLLLGSRFARNSAAPDLRPNRADDPAIVSIGARIEAAIGPHFTAADRLASRYAALYRASATLRYLAVLPATLGALLALGGPEPLPQIGWLLQLGVLVGILLLFWLDRRAGWHRRFLDYRTLAEHLRQSRLLALFGSTDSLQRLPPHHAAIGSDWIDWQLRQVVRGLGLVAARVDPAYLRGVKGALRQEVVSQLRYYHLRAHRARRLAVRLQVVGTAFFALGVGLTALRIGFAVSSTSGPAGAHIAELALVVPALAPVFFGLLSQHEYERLAERYIAMDAQLRRTLAELDATTDAEASRIERIARATVAILLAEVSDWRVLIKARRISPY